MRMWFAKPSIRKFWACSMKRILAICLVLLLCGCGAQDVFDSSCTVTVDCVSVLENDELRDGLREIIPQDGIIFSGEVEFASGENLLDVLTRAMKDAKIPAVREGAFVSSIGGLASGDCGPMSGWSFTINGTFATMGCDEIILNDGDTVAWTYVTEWTE